jgi:phage terminase large subunit
MKNNIPILSKLRIKTSKVFFDIYNDYNFENTEIKQGYVFEGGTRSSKTWSIIQFVIVYCAIYQNQNKRIRICRQKLTWLKMTLMFDFFKILEQYNLYNPKLHNKSDNIYKLFGNTIIFLGLDEKQKLHGATQELFWFNEAIEAKYDDFKQLNQRTTECFICDYNPSATEHWVYDHVITRPDVKFFHSTQLDNPFLPESIRREILSYEPTEENIKNGTADQLYWEIYGLGNRAAPRGIVFPDWNFVQKMPKRKDRKITGYCIDYGFTNDPTSINEICLAHGQIWINELVYEKGLTSIINKAKPGQPSIEQRLLEHKVRKKYDPIVAESADPRINVELSLAGFNILPIKNKSIKTGIAILKRYRVNVTESSLNIKKEINNYKWKWDDDLDKPLNEPVDLWNHALDAIRYWALYYLIKSIQMQSKRNITSKAQLGF